MKKFWIAAIIIISFSCSKRETITSDNGDPGKPNILFIMADDHTSQAIGAYKLRLSKLARTPNIDRLASQGALLTNAFCTNSICVPSRASILTGQYSHRNNVRYLSDTLDTENDNLAKSLQRAGYETAVIGKWHLKSQPAGFDYYNILRGQGAYNNPILYENTQDFENGGNQYQGHSTDVITDITLNWLEDHRSPDKPFMLMCHFKAVHEPFYSHDRFRNLYDSLQIPEPNDLFWPESPQDRRFEGWPLEILTQRFINNKDRYPPPYLEIDSENPEKIREKTYQKFVKDYLRAVAGIDENVGRILDYLNNSDELSNTIVIYTSDQGYFLGEHNLFDKRFMLEESMRMPFIIRYPKEIEAGIKIDQIILNVDFPSLLIDYAGAEQLLEMQGRSFRSVLTGTTRVDWRESMYYHYWTHQKERPSHYGIRTEQYKLIYYYGLADLGISEDQSWELYDLVNDPQEYYNIYDKIESTETIKELKQQLKILKTELQDESNPFKVD